MDKTCRCEHKVKDSDGGDIFFVFNLVILIPLEAIIVILIYYFLNNVLNTLILIHYSLVQ